MYTVIPIAGPEYEYGQSSKALTHTQNGPFLKYILDSRPWRYLLNTNDYIFVLKDTDGAREFCTDVLQVWFPGCQFVYLTHCAQGAAFSVAAALSQLKLDLDVPIIVDLADIYIETNTHDFLGVFTHYDYTAFSFENSSPIYSYFLVDLNMSIVDAKEKSVISSNASAGVYVFSKLSLFFESLSNILAHSNEYFFNNLCYVAPLFSSAQRFHRSSKLIRCSFFQDPKMEPF